MFNYPNWPNWNVILWCGGLGLLFVLEFLGIFNVKDATLTRIICDTIPSWLRWMILGWLIYHFGIQNP